MADIRQVTESFAVAPQLEASDFAELAAMGFRHVINNRPDGETLDQMTSAEAASAAKAAGLTYVHAPFVGPPTADAVKAAMRLSKKTIAYCRSGTRCITAWAMAQAGEGESAEFIIEAAADAGYNLSTMGSKLRQLGAS